MFNIDEELKKLPEKPGIYIMHGENDEIIMSEWSSGSYVEQWEKAFVDGELIIEN